jgi:hypothetical protein
MSRSLELFLPTVIKQGFIVSRSTRKMGKIMGYTAKWKVLEDMMVELRRKGVEVPPTVINDLRSAKLLIKIAETGESAGDTTLKLEEILGSVESYLVTEAQNILSAQSVDDWLRQLDEATMPTCEIKCERENTFIIGVPRDQKWIRVEPMPNLQTERLKQIAKESNLSTNQQKDGRLVVYGQQEDIKAFLKKMAEEATKK